jgi:DNA topoisomerase-1
LYKTKNAAQDAHEAIRPTDVSKTPDVAQLSGDQHNIYRLVWAKFVASQMKSAVYDTVNVDVTTSSGHLLKAEGKVLKYSGWLDIAGEFTKKDKDVKLPKLVVGDSLVLVPPKVKVEKKATKPPSRFNDRTIIKEMEKKDIGRPSTYASIIARIFGRNYVKREKSGFVPTELGCRVVDDLKGQFSFMDYKYTAQMEKQLDKMSEGNLDYIEMLTAFFTPFKEEFRKAQNSQGQDAGIKCPECQDGMTVRHGKYGYFASCVKYPDCKGSMSGTVKDGKFISKPGKKREAIPDIKCPECDGEMYRFDGKFGPIYLCTKYPKCNGKRKIPFGKKCNKCGGEFYLTVFDDEPKLACMEYPDCKNIVPIPKGAKLDWTPPGKVAAPKKLHRRVEKVLK